MYVSKYPINSRYTKETVDELTYWANKKGWRSLANAQENATKLGLKSLRKTEDSSAEFKIECLQHTVEYLEEQIEKWKSRLTEAKLK